MRNIIYKTDVKPTFEKLDELTYLVGWGKRGKFLWKKIFEKSSFISTAWDGDDLVGFGRILEDGVMCMIYDIAIHPNYQNNGIGTKIMNSILTEVHNNNYDSVGLFAWDKNPNNISFYNKFGFECVDFGMKLIK